MKSYLKHWPNEYVAANQDIISHTKNSILGQTCWVGLEFYGPVNTIKVMSSQSVYLNSTFHNFLQPIETEKHPYDISDI